MSVITLILPYPPSVNQTWRHGKATGQVYLSPEVRQYRERVKKVVALTGAEHRLTNELSYSASLHPPADNIVRDLDNHFKAVWDALKHAKVIRDDSQFKQIKDVQFCAPSESPRIEITLQLLTPASGEFHE